MFFVCNSFNLLCTGVPELSPMILGTLENMKIIWSTNHPDVVDIFGVFSEAGKYFFLYAVI